MWRLVHQLLKIRVLQLMVLFDSSLTVTSECRVEDPVELEARAAPQFLQSPNYPFFYKPLTYCRWILKAKESHVITVEVLDTDTEGSPTCNKDFIEIRDGKYQWDYALRRWCGNKLPANFTGYKDAMFVTFKTDDSEQGRGFRFKYWSTPKHLMQYKQVEFRAVNYFLMALSATLLVSVLTTCTVIWINRSASNSQRLLRFNRKIFNTPAVDSSVSVDQTHRITIHSDNESNA